MPENLSSLDRLRRWVNNPSDVLHMRDVAWLLAEIDASREYKGQFAVAHARYTEASELAATAMRRVEEQDELIRTFQMGVDEPLWRRISNQRREIRAAWARAEMYKRWWRKEKDG